jgi:transposase InsO family protein
VVHVRSVGRVADRPAGLRRPVPDDSAVSASRILLDVAVRLPALGVRIERVLTDNAWAYTSPTFARTIESVEARHKHTRPHRPQTTARPSG